MRILFIVVVFLSAAAARAGQKESVTEFLKRFHANPAREMERLPARWNSRGETAAPRYIDHDRVAEAMEFRLRTRDAIVGAQAWPSIDIGQGSPDGKDFAEKLVEGGVVLRNMQEMENRGLTKAVLATLPWPDSYWPYFRGVISNRYAEHGYPRSTDWATNYQYIRMRPASVVIASGDTNAINALAPAEKYDYAVGDWNFTLTNHGWLQGQRQVEKYGTVAKWMGICHGWSAAAHMLTPIPSGPVTVIAASGRPVTFYPQDIKALQSMLWANASPATRFVGNRCNVTRPSRNRNGRILDPKCFDSNPGTWHMIMTNQLGVNQRSFVMDSNYDLEVWNFAVASYQYRYFNPETWKEGATLRSSLVPMSQYRVDKFREFRSPQARYVVGVAMDVQYVNAIAPTRNPKVKTPLKTIRYVYDLELDEGMNIVGGEWYSNAHPDFLWTFDRDAQAMTAADSSLMSEGWMADRGVPAAWTEAARRSSARGAPLFSFIRGVIGAAPAAGE
jgi:hypothetical protein